MTIRTKRRLRRIGSVLLVLLAVIFWQLDNLGAALILYPLRKRVSVPQPSGLENVSLPGSGISLSGWRGQATGATPWRGTLVYLHGVMDNRASSASVLGYFQQRGFDVLAFDSRAHGDSGGDCCTYGFHEKEDLSRVLDTVKPGPILLLGTSLGAAIALQTAAVDARITGVIAAECFSDFRTVARERAPWFFSERCTQQAFAIAERKGAFQLADVSPATAAKSIATPTLLIHGESDTETPPAHSHRISSMKP